MDFPSLAAKREGAVAPSWGLQVLGEGGAEGLQGEL